MKAINLVCTVAAMLGGCAVDDAGTQEGEVENTAVAEQAATQTDVWHATWNGASVNASSYGYLRGAYVDAWEYKSGSTRYAYLTLSSWSVDPTSEQCFNWTDWWGNTWGYCYYTRSTYSWGWGSIPESDLQVNPGTARLNTTLGSTFYGTTCTWDWYDWTQSGCTSMAGGTIDLRFNKDGNVSAFSSGTSQYSYGAYTYKNQGTYRYSSAQANGTVLGNEFASNYGQFGDTRGVNVSKSVIRTPNP